MNIVSKPNLDHKQVGSYVYGNKSSDSTEGGRYLDQLSGYQILLRVLQHGMSELLPTNV
jgi:hypothetical protein